MSRIVLPGMVEKRNGAIINVSSASGAKPTPCLALYSATKVKIFGREGEIIVKYMTMS